MCYCFYLVGYTTSEIVYEWQEAHETLSRQYDIPQFILKNFTIIKVTRKFLTGKMSFCLQNKVFKLGTPYKYRGSENICNRPLWLRCLLTQLKPLENSSHFSCRHFGMKKELWRDCELGNLHTKPKRSILRDYSHIISGPGGG